MSDGWEDKTSFWPLSAIATDLLRCMSHYFRRIEIKEFTETTITIEKEATGLGLGVVGGSDTFLVRTVSKCFNS